MSQMWLVIYGGKATDCDFVTEDIEEHQSPSPGAPGVIRGRQEKNTTVNRKLHPSWKEASTNKKMSQPSKHASAP